MKRAAFRNSTSARNSKSISQDDFEYAERCAFWLEKSKERPKNFRKKRRDRTPVILNGHGASLRIDRGTLLIRNGLTHFPQEREEYRFFRGDLNLPSRILMLDGSGSISFDVLAWLGDQNIPLIQLNWRGDVVTVASENGHSADPKLVASQIASHDNGKAQEIARQLIAKKLSNSINTLRICAPISEAKEAAIALVTKQSILLAEKRCSPGALLGLEGQTAAAYFKAFHGMPINWKGIVRRPIPRDWYAVGPRLSPFTESNWKARHPINAMLNYGYALLQTHTRIRIVAAGLDPAIGYMHGRSDRKRENLVFDLMEPLRPVVDRVVFELVQKTFSPKDFEIMPNGVCRLNPQMARTLAHLIAGAIGEVVPKNRS